MGKQKFETQPHFVSGVFDGRVLGIDAAFSEPNPPEFDFDQMALELGEKLKPRRSEGFVNGLTQVGYAARDGEDASGFVEVVQIDTPDRDRKIAIRSALFSHATGLPHGTASWMCMFDEPDLGQDFWRTWRPRSFHYDDVEEALENHGAAGEEGVTLQMLGLLKPWFHQRPGDRIFLDDFSTDGKSLINTERLRPSTRFVVGQVYKIPESNWFSTKVRSHYLDTCLGAFTINSTRGSWYLHNERKVTKTIIQWADGSLVEYLDDTESNPAPPAPEPVTLRELKARESISEAV